jgi:hypothetical protein
MRTEGAVYRVQLASWRSIPARLASNSTAYTAAPSSDVSSIRRQQLIIHRVRTASAAVHRLPLVPSSFEVWLATVPFHDPQCFFDTRTTICTRKISLVAVPGQTKPGTWLNACRKVFTAVAMSQNHMTKTLLFQTRDLSATMPLSGGSTP